MWQNSSRDVYTLMALPVEETLRYYVGRATDNQLAKTLRLTPPHSIGEARKLAEEESIVVDW